MDLGGGTRAVSGRFTSGDILGRLLFGGAEGRDGAGLAGVEQNPST